MNITEITKKAGAHPKRKRVGRGEGSGMGKTSGRGNKGAGARPGRKNMPLAEGGMFPLYRRLPKFGFNNANFRVVYRVVNVADLDARFDADGRVTPAVLEEAGLIRSAEDPVKVLGDGEIKKKLHVEAHRFSASAASKIEAAGGSVKWLAPRPKKKFIKRPKQAPPPADKAEAKAGKGEAKAGKAEAKGGKSPEGKPQKKAHKESQPDAPAADQKQASGEGGGE